MKRSSKTRSIKFYPNGENYAPYAPKSRLEDHHESIENSFTNDEIQSEVEPIFEAANQKYELISKCNTLEYQKAKDKLAFQNIVSELRQKNLYLQQLASSLSLKNQEITEERDEIRAILSEVRQRNHQLTKQIEGFKLQIREIEGLKRQTDREDQQISIRKNEQIVQLQNQVISLQRQLDEQSSKESANILKKQIISLQNELNVVKNELSIALKNQQDIQTVEKQRQEYSKLLRLKQDGLKLLQEQLNQKQQQNEQLKQNCLIKQKKILTSHAEQVKKIIEQLKNKDQQLKQSEKDKSILETKLGDLTVQLGRFRSQNAGLQQYNKYLEGCHTETEAGRKKLQQQMYQAESQISQLRTLLFNEKLQNKKMLSNLRISFEEERLKHIEQIEQKSKEVFKLKELSASSHRQSVDYDQINNRCHSLTIQIQKLNKQTNNLKNENQRLKQDMKKLEVKYEKKNEKYAILQKEIKAECQDRIKSLQSEIYRLHIQNSQQQIKVENQGRQKKNEFLPQQQQENISDVVELLKIEKKQKQILLAQAEQKALKQSQKILSIESQLQILKRSQGKNIYNKEQSQAKIVAITELQCQISRLNDQLRKQRSVNNQLRKDTAQKEQKLLLELRRSQEKLDSLKKKEKLFFQQKQENFCKISQLQSELKAKKNVEEEIKRLFEEFKREKEKQVEQWKENQQRQLQKKENSIKQRRSSKNLQIENMTADQIRQKCNLLQKQNHKLKMDYSDALEQINSLLLNYRNCEQNNKRLIGKNEDLKKELNILKQNKIGTDNLMTQLHTSQQLNLNYQAEVRRLNKILSERQYSESHKKPREQIKNHQINDLWLNSQEKKLGSYAKKEDLSHIRVSNRRY